MSEGCACLPSGTERAKESAGRVEGEGPVEFFYKKIGLMLGGGLLSDGESTVIGSSMDAMRSAYCACAKGMVCSPGTGIQAQAREGMVNSSTT